MSSFDSCFAFTISVEGDYTSDPNDPGNWTGGVVGKGRILGTKYGISAAAYPGTDIPSLTLEEAKAIYRQNQWSTIDGESLAPELAMVMFDSAVNSGASRAIIWLQNALAVTADGILGAETKAALAGADPAQVAREVVARRIDFLAQLSTWARFGLGWSRRVTELAFTAAQFS
jgi:lysozyme family protein